MKINIETNILDTQCQLNRLYQPLNYFCFEFHKTEPTTCVAQFNCLARFIQFFQFQLALLLFSSNAMLSSSSGQKLKLIYYNLICCFYCLTPSSVSCFILQETVHRRDRSPKMGVWILLGLQLCIST